MEPTTSLKTETMASETVVMMPWMVSIMMIYLSVERIRSRDTPSRWALCVAPLTLTQTHQPVLGHEEITMNTQLWWGWSNYVDMHLRRS